MGSTQQHRVTFCTTVNKKLGCFPFGNPCPLYFFAQPGRLGTLQWGLGSDRIPPLSLSLLEANQRVWGRSVGLVQFLHASLPRTALFWVGGSRFLKEITNSCKQRDWGRLQGRGSGVVASCWGWFLQGGVLVIRGVPRSSCSCCTAAPAGFLSSHRSVSLSAFTK